jgi:hypothetical protein
MKNMSKTILTFLAAGVIGCGLLSSPAQAGLSTSGTLADLAANGGSIGIGDKVFSGFSLPRLANGFRQQHHRQRVHRGRSVLPGLFMKYQRGRCS